MDKPKTITILSGTNRKGSYTKQVANIYKDLLFKQGHQPKMLCLDEHDIYRRDGAFLQLENEYLIPATNFIIVSPEYNGSYPGILKLLIDNSDVAKAWHKKSALLTGVSTGRAGNLRGMEFLTGTLLHMKMNVHHNRLPISSVHLLMDENGKFADEYTIVAIENQLKEYLEN